MKVLSIQVGLPRDVEFRGQTVRTGIFKEPIKGSVFVKTLGLTGDGQADLSVHGGVDKAVYAYSVDTFVKWKTERPADTFGFGVFGENLSVETLPEDRIFVGDTFELGGAVLQAIQPRFPCYKLGVKFGDPSIGRVFQRFGRPGVYFKVLKEGDIMAGQELKRVSQEQTRISISDVFGFIINGEIDPLQMRDLEKLTSLPDSLRAHILSRAE